MKPVKCNMRFSLPAVLVIVLVAAGSCAPSANSRTQTGLMVFAAMSLRKPMTEIAQLYEQQHPGTRVSVNCAGSSSLVAQVIAGAPADVFAAASLQDIETLKAKGAVDVASIRVFAANSVVLIAPSGGKPAIPDFSDLTSDKVKRIAVVNPKLAPVGSYAAEVLSYYGIREQVGGKLIYCDQVAQVCDYTSRGEVDAGIVYFTDYMSRRDQLVLVEQAPTASHTPVEYPVAVIKGSHNEKHALQFIEMLCSGQGTAALSACGFKQLMEAKR